ncbi:MAG: thioredoxin family protein [Planctomycetaceae bacterium]
MKKLGMFAWVLIVLSGPVGADDHGPFALGLEPADRKIEGSPRNLSARRTQWWMFTADWCAPCQAARHDFEGWLKRSGWRVDESPQAEVRIIDIDREPQIAQEFAIRTYPTFLLMQNGKELRRLDSYPGREQLVQLFQDAVHAAPAAGAISVGTITGQRDNIARLIASARPLLGEGGTVTLAWDRAGSAPAVLPLGEHFSIRVEKSLTMTYTMDGDVLTCRFSSPYPRGRFRFGLPVEQTVSAVSLSMSEVLFELPRAPDVRLRVEP